MLALTHAHPDHMYHADEFQTVCLGKADIQAWKGPLKLATDVLVGMRKLPKKKFPVETYVPVTGRTRIDLGGNVIEVIEAPATRPVRCCMWITSTAVFLQATRWAAACSF